MSFLWLFQWPSLAHDPALVQEVQDKSSSSQGSGQGRSGGLSFRADPKVIKRLHRLEKHMRENKLRHSFADQLGEAQESDELNSKKEARKLAFYLFWNVRPNFDRYVLPSDMKQLWQYSTCRVPSLQHASSWVWQLCNVLTSKYAHCHSLQDAACDLFPVGVCKRSV